MKSTQHLTACDLMTGDWVQIVPDAPAMANEYHRIDWIRTGEIGLDNRNIVTYPYIQPIPLTPEILEKNCRGYKRGSGALTHFIYELNEEYFIRANTRSVILCTHYDDSEYAVQDDIYLVVLRYVHELQHALKLFRIDKTIEL